MIKASDSKYSLINNQVGFMQGRLSPIRNGRIQSFPWDHWKNEFKVAEELELNKIEWTIDSERFLENPILTVEGQKEIKRLLQLHGLQIPSVTCDYFMENPFWKNSKTLVRDNLIKIMDGMNQIGAKILVIPLVDNSSLSDYRETNNMVDFFTSLGMEFLESDLQIAFESDLPPNSLLTFISNFDSEKFGINYDIGNSASLGYSPDEEFIAYGERIINVHIKDRVYGGSTVPLGEGSADFKTVFRSLNLFHYNGNLIMQTARSKNDEHGKVLVDYRKMIFNWIEDSSNAN